MTLVLFLIRSDPILCQNTSQETVYPLRIQGDKWVYLGEQHDFLIKRLEDADMMEREIFKLYDSLEVFNIKTIDTQANTINILARVNEQQNNNITSAFEVKDLTNDELNIVKNINLDLKKNLKKEKRRKKFWRIATPIGSLVSFIGGALLLN